MNEAAVTQAHIQGHDTFIIDKSVALKHDHSILISDCTHAEVHDIDRIEPTRGGHLVYLKKPLVFDYGTQVYVGEWMEEAFYFKKALFYKQHRVDKLTSHIKHMVFELDNHTSYPMLSMQVTLHNGASDSLKARVRMP